MKKELFKTEKKLEISTEDLEGVRAFIIDDEFEMRDMINSYLKEFKVNVYDSDNGDNILEKLKVINPDILLIDFFLEKRNGIDVVAEIRQHPEYNSLPIIMFTGFHKQEDEIRAFDIGIDNFLEKPFFPYELVVRMKALIKRRKNNIGQKVVYKDFEICLKTYQSFYRKENLNLSKTETIVLGLILKKPNELTLKEDIINHFNRKMKIRTLDVHMVRIRQALMRRNLNPIQSFNKIGYRFNF